MKKTVHKKNPRKKIMQGLQEKSAKNKVHKIYLRKKIVHKKKLKKKNSAQNSSAKIKQCTKK